MAITAFFVPSPTISEFGLKAALHHVGNVVSNYWQELPAMKRAASCHVETMAMRMWRD